MSPRSRLTRFASTNREPATYSTRRSFTAGSAANTRPISATAAASIVAGAVLRHRGGKSGAMSQTVSADMPLSDRKYAARESGRRPEKAAGFRRKRLVVEGSLSMKMNLNTPLVLFASAVIIAFLAIANWVVTAISQESSEVRASIDQATSDLSVSNMKDELKKELSELTGLPGMIFDEDSREPDDPEPPNTLLGAAFRKAHRMSSRLDQMGQKFLQLSPEEVQSMGQQVHGQLRRQLRIIDNEKETNRLEQLAQPFTGDAPSISYDVSFHIVEASEVNAFAHIGGHVYVTSALLKFSDSDEELQFVLGHEIAHIRLGHCSAQMTYAAQAAKLTGDLGQHVTLLAYRAIAVGYSEDHEFAADAWSCQRAPACRGAAVAFLGRLNELYPKTESLREAGHQGLPDAIPDLVDEMNKHFRTHPDTDERVKRLSSR